MCPSCLSGFYRIHLNSENIDVYCDMEEANSGGKNNIRNLSCSFFGFEFTIPTKVKMIKELIRMDVVTYVIRILKCSPTQTTNI